MKRKVNQDNKDVFAIIVLVLLIAYSLSLLLSLYWVLLSSLKTRGDFRYHKLFQFPREFCWKNFTDVFETMRLQDTSGRIPRFVYFPEMLWNSIWLPITVTVCSLLVRVCTAYVLAKFKFKGNEILYAVFFFSMVIPVSNTLPAMLKLLRTLGIYDKPISVILMNMHVCDTSFLILYAGYKNLSWEYAEAAIVEGASHVRIMFQIMIPLMAPIIATYFLLGVVGLWNDYTINLQFLKSTPMVSYGLFDYFQPGANKSSVPLHLAASVIVTAPILLLFIMFKDKFMGNLTLGGLKG